MFAHAVVAFVLLPGVVAYLVPATWAWATGQVFRWPYGVAAIALGSAGLLWCVRDFHVSGKGTLAPWTPPQALVTVGLYRWSRNPMYVCVVMVLLGWAIAFGSADLLVYALAVAVGFHLRVVFGEEPWLARVHGADWQQYSRRVRRWL